MKALVLGILIGIFIGFMGAGFFSQTLWPVKEVTVTDRLDKPGVMK